MRVMRVGALFAGYDGIGLGLERIWPGQTEVAWYSEIEPAACRVLAAHHPGVPNLGDITTVNWEGVAPVDVLTGGYQPMPAVQPRRKATGSER